MKPNKIWQYNGLEVSDFYEKKKDSNNVPMSRQEKKRLPLSTNTISLRFWYNNSDGIYYYNNCYEISISFYASFMNLLSTKVKYTYVHIWWIFSISNIILFLHRYTALLMNNVFEEILLKEQFNNIIALVFLISIRILLRDIFGTTHVHTKF